MSTVFPTNTLPFKSLVPSKVPGISLHCVELLGTTMEKFYALLFLEGSLFRSEFVYVETQEMSCQGTQILIKICILIHLTPEKTFLKIQISTIDNHTDTCTLYVTDSQFKTQYNFEKLSVLRM